LTCLTAKPRPPDARQKGLQRQAISDLFPGPWLTISETDVSRLKKRKFPKRDSLKDFLEGSNAVTHAYHMDSLLRLKSVSEATGVSGCGLPCHENRYLLSLA